jgi:ubiquinone/menaquinone biosynthesis C-methylase UbiE
MTMLFSRRQSGRFLADRVWGQVRPMAIRSGIYDALAPRAYDEVLEASVDAAKLGPSMRILDVAARSGRLLVPLRSELLRFRCSYFGLDAWPEAISVASRRATELSLSSYTEFACADLSVSIPAESGKYDVVFANFALYAFASGSRRLRALHEIRRVLRDEGRLILTHPARHYCATAIVSSEVSSEAQEPRRSWAGARWASLQMLESFERSIEHRIAQRTFTGHTEDSLCAELRAAELDVRECTSVYVGTSFLVCATPHARSAFGFSIQMPQLS